MIKDLVTYSKNEVLGKKKKKNLFKCQKWMQIM